MVCILFCSRSPPDLYSQSGRVTNPVSSASRSSTIVCSYFRKGYTMFDLSVTDMPICDGVEAAKRIRLLENKRKAPTVLPSRVRHNSISYTDNECSRCP
jgi:hypothetical protein